MAECIHCGQEMTSCGICDPSSRYSCDCIDGFRCLLCERILPRQHELDGYRTALRNAREAMESVCQPPEDDEDYCFHKRIYRSGSAKTGAGWEHAWWNVDTTLLTASITEIDKLLGDDNG